MDKSELFGCCLLGSCPILDCLDTITIYLSLNNWENIPLLTFYLNLHLLSDSSLPQCDCDTSSWERHAWHGYAAGGHGDRDVWLQLQAVGPPPSALCPCAAVGWHTHWRQQGGHSCPQDPRSGGCASGWCLPGDPTSLLCGTEVPLK